jgi:hypothetical protein
MSLNRGVAFKLAEHSDIWDWAAKHGWIAPIYWDHDIHDEVAGVSLNWNGLTDYSLWKCGRTGDIVAADWIGTELVRGPLPAVLDAVALAATHRSKLPH